MITTLVDTNVLVYAAGVNTDQARQRVALDSLRQVRPVGALAVQVLAEFSSVLLRQGSAVEAVRHDVERLAASWPVLVPDASTVPRALAGIRDHGLSFWDAMLWATALEHDVSTILSEDGPSGLSVGGIRYASPF
ncbi:MAG: PIN domain-containing protein [Sulfobacillus sp.]